jgi:hypothetical protein
VNTYILYATPIKNNERQTDDTIILYVDAPNDDALQDATAEKLAGFPKGHFLLDGDSVDCQLRMKKAPTPMFSTSEGWYIGTVTYYVTTGGASIDPEPISDERFDSRDDAIVWLEEKAEAEAAMHEAEQVAAAGTQIFS